MKHTLRNLSIAAVFATSLGAGANASTTTDLAFIMDRSDSISEGDYDDAMASLANALDASIPVGDPDNQYSITVITFNNTSTAANGDVLVNSSIPTNAAELTVITDAIRGDIRNTSGGTCYVCAFNLLASTVTPSGHNSIINMMTDGEPNVGGANLAAIAPSRNALIDDGWDSLSFEGVGLTANGGPETLLTNLAFDTVAIGGQPVLTDPADITRPVTANSFVLRVGEFGEDYDDAIRGKVTAITGVPVPAALPLLLAGLGMFGALRLRKSKTASA